MKNLTLTKILIIVIIEIIIITTGAEYLINRVSNSFYLLIYILIIFSILVFNIKGIRTTLKETNQIKQKRKNKTTKI